MCLVGREESLSAGVCILCARAFSFGWLRSHHRAPLKLLEAWPRSNLLAESQKSRPGRQDHLRSRPCLGLSEGRKRATMNGIVHRMPANQITASLLIISPSSDTGQKDRSRVTTSMTWHLKNRLTSPAVAMAWRAQGSLAGYRRCLGEACGALARHFRKRHIRPHVCRIFAV